MDRSNMHLLSKSPGLGHVNVDYMNLAYENRLDTGQTAQMYAYCSITYRRHSNRYETYFIPLLMDEQVILGECNSHGSLEYHISIE